MYERPSGSLAVYVLFRQCSHTASGRERTEVPTATEYRLLAWCLCGLIFHYDRVLSRLLTPQVAPGSTLGAQVQAPRRLSKDSLGRTINQTDHGPLDIQAQHTQLGEGGQCLIRAHLGRQMRALLAGRFDAADILGDGQRRTLGDLPALQIALHLACALRLRGRVRHCF